VEQSRGKRRLARLGGAAVLLALGSAAFVLGAVQPWNAPIGPARLAADSLPAAGPPLPASAAARRGVSAGPGRSTGRVPAPRPARTAGVTTPAGSGAAAGGATVQARIVGVAVPGSPATVRLAWSVTSPGWIMTGQREDWGDGTAASSTVRTCPASAGGGAAGVLLLTHTFDAPGSYRAGLRITLARCGRGGPAATWTGSAGVTVAVVAAAAEPSADAPPPPAPAPTPSPSEAPVPSEAPSPAGDDSPLKSLIPPILAY
jgi:hypothetical protein